MRIIAWNCQGAFRTKAHSLDGFDADILVISESESPDFLAQKGFDLGMQDHLWEGNHPFKGLSVFARNGYRAKIADSFVPEFRFVLPIEVLGSENFLLLAVWTQAETPQRKGYVTHISNAVQHYYSQFDGHVVIAGDFNSSPVFTTSGPVHEAMVAFLAERGIHSAYHQWMNAAHGAEDDPSFYLTKKREKPYHLDYVFHGSGWRRMECRIGKFDDWIDLSDHMPLIVELNPV